MMAVLKRVCGINNIFFAKATEIGDDIPSLDILEGHLWVG